MARFYGDTRDLINQAMYIAKRAGIDLDMAECRYCKAARTRSLKTLLAFAEAIRASGTEWTRSYRLEDLAIKFEYAGCTRHKREQRRAWNCSPTSESYWTA